MSWSTEYPRPLMRRESFLALTEGWTLNGKPIRVPFPPEAKLSGFTGHLTGGLDYKTVFTLPGGFLSEGHRLILHLGAVDQTADVLVNGIPVVSHEGGYLPFSADITAALRGERIELRVLARDTLSPAYPYGKQSAKPHGMWYTPVSGIWQTVWLEAVPSVGAVRSLRTACDLESVTFTVDTDVPYTVTIPAAGLRVESAEKRLQVPIPSPRLWTPEEPNLYDFTVETATDRVTGYFALRTVTLRGEAGGHTRLCLNGEPVFLHGVLDQGYFQDGLFLPAEPEEYERDIRRMRELGFNTLRKHVKLEPETFYAACDRLGMLVLQDMVNAGKYHRFRDTVLPNLGFTRRNDSRAVVTRRQAEQFEANVRGTIERLRSHPCVIGYTIFNEGWGQYDSDRIYQDCKKADPTRVFISTSGWFARKESDARSHHVYLKTKVLKPAKPGRFLILSECGGFSRRVKGHVMKGRRNYGYGRRQDTEEELTGKIAELYDRMVLPSMDNGLCGSIYTQLSDVEGETNGLYTYDRQVCKVTKSSLLEIAKQLKVRFDDLVGKKMY